MSNHHAAHGIKALLEDLPPLRKKKNPLIAALAGFFLGGVGLGLYLQSWKDCVYPILVFILLSIIFPGVGTIAALFFAAIWGFARASGSSD
ncbi:MAG: hypothetical protein ABSG03_14060 [Bryobacteraceae bacterium]|jgi:hypothetical protein